MPLPAFRNSRSKVRRRRSHHALKPITINACKACGADVLPHRACAKCGAYNGRQVKGGMEAVEKTLAKETKAKTKKATKTKKAEEGHEGHDHAGHNHE